MVELRSAYLGIIELSKNAPLLVPTHFQLKIIRVCATLVTALPILQPHEVQNLKTSQYTADPIGGVSYATSIIVHMPMVWYNTTFSSTPS